MPGNRGNFAISSIHVMITLRKAEWGITDMLAGKIGFSVCLVLATAQAAGAAQKDPASGSVSCYCSCRSVDENGDRTNYHKVIGGTEGTWTQSRSACQEFNGGNCRGRDRNGNWHPGKLTKCDIQVLSERPGKTPQAPAADTLAPGTETQGGGTNKLKLRVQPKLLTQ